MADHSTISRSSMKARKARARDVGDCMTHNPQRGDGEGQGGLHVLCRIFLVSWGLQWWNGVGGGKWEIECDARMGVNVCRAVLAGLYNSSKVPALEESAQEISIFDTFPFSLLSIPLQWRLSI